MSEQDPWEYHPDLNPTRLNLIASILASMRNHVIESTDDAFEVPWGIGCMIYDRTCVKLKYEQLNYDWLSIKPDCGKALLGVIGSVPFRFYKGEPESPTKRTLAERNDELRQRTLSMLDEEESEISIWRFAVDTDLEGKCDGISFVGFNRCGDVLCNYKCTPKTDMYDAVELEKLPKQEARKVDLPPIEPKAVKGHHEVKKSANK